MGLKYLRTKFNFPKLSYIQWPGSNIFSLQDHYYTRHMIQVASYFVAQNPIYSIVSLSASSTCIKRIVHGTISILQNYLFLCLVKVVQQNLGQVMTIQSCNKVILITHTHGSSLGEIRIPSDVHKKLESFRFQLFNLMNVLVS